MHLTPTSHVNAGPGRRAPHPGHSPATGRGFRSAGCRRPASDGASCQRLRRVRRRLASDAGRPDPTRPGVETCAHTVVGMHKHLPLSLSPSLSLSPLALDRITVKAVTASNCKSELELDHSPSPKKSN